MKIIHIIPSLRKGGAERLVQDICEEIHTKTSHEIKLITFSEENTKQKLHSFHLHLKSNYTPSITSKSLLNIDNLQKFINKFKPDIIHSHLWESEILLTKIDINNAVRFSHFHDNIPQLNTKIVPKNKKQLINFFEKKIFLNRNNNNFICISNDTFEYAKRVLPKKNNIKIHLIPNAINFHNFYSNYEVNFNEINLINIGSFVPKKNQKLALLILKNLLKKGYKSSITFLGEGPLLFDLISLSKDIGLEKYVNFKGNVEDVKQYLSKSNVMLHTANYEPFGLVLLEAMASGVPVISLDGKGNRDFIKNHTNGVIIEEENVELFVKEIEKLFSNKDYYKKIKFNGYDTSKKHDIKNYINKLLTFYFSAMK
jgi:glycosyltransferase involved in cell wall biosynthesis